MENTPKRHIALKILLALLPALIFTQNYAWMTLNSYLGIGFMVIWALMIWSVWQFTEKNHILERFFRQTEISFFLLPLSAIVLAFVIGSRAVTSTSGEVEQTGAALGTAIGGTFVVVVAFIIGLTGGIIMHVIANNYDKKAEAAGVKQSESLSNKHGIILSLVGVIILAVLMGSVSSAQRSEKIAKEKEELSSRLQQAGPSKDHTKKSRPPEHEIKKVELDITNKQFNKADFMSGNYKDTITMDFKFTNKTAKEIKGVEGVVTFYDIFDNKILSTRMSYDEGIPANGEKVWRAGIDYNPFIDEHQKLKNTSLQNLKYEWEVKTIIYADNSKETF